MHTSSFDVTNAANKKINDLMYLPPDHVVTRLLPVLFRIVHIYLSPQNGPCTEPYDRPLCYNYIHQKKNPGDVLVLRDHRVRVRLPRKRDNSKSVHPISKIFDKYFARTFVSSAIGIGNVGLSSPISWAIMVGKHAFCHFSTLHGKIIVRLL